MEAMTVRVDLEAIRGNLRVVRSLAGDRACTMSTCPDPSAKEAAMRTSRVRHVWTALVVATLLVAGTQAGAQEKSRLDVVVERGKLIVVTLTTVPPFAFNDDKGQLVGFDIDIARLLAQALFKDPTKVLVTHALRFAREVAHRIAYLSEGSIVELGTPAEILDRPKDPTLKEFLRRMR